MRAGGGAAGDRAAARVHTFPEPVGAEARAELTRVRARSCALDGALAEARSGLGRAHPRGLLPEDLAPHAAVSAVVTAAAGGDPAACLREMEARAPAGWRGPGSELGGVAARALGATGGGWRSGAAGAEGRR